MVQKIIIAVFVLFFVVAILYMLYTFGLHKENENKAKYENIIQKNEILLDSLKKVNKATKTKLDSLQFSNEVLKVNEKEIIKTIYIKNETISKIKSLPNILPDSANYRFFAEFEADTTAKR